MVILALLIIEATTDITCYYYTAEWRDEGRISELSKLL